MKKSLMSILAIFAHGLVLPQADPRAYEDPYINQINPIVKAQFGGIYSVGVEVIDTVIGTRNSIETEEISDPYGTLQHCVLFYATKDGDEQDSSFIGIFKNGSILWESDRVIKGAPLHTFSVADINNDGVVDILTTWFFNSDPRYQGMWIFSWNGTTGSLINQVDTSELGFSAITGTFFELIDANSDGVNEIRSILSNGTEQSFIWNGTMYILGASAQQVPQRTFLPANQLTPRVTSSVTVSGTAYTYNYIWSNNQVSKQAIHGIYLQDVWSVCTPIKPQKWLFAAWPDTMVVGWNALLYFEEMIMPGKNRSDFGLTCPGLPSIVSYFVQGYRATPIEGDNDQEITTEEYRNDIFTNSVHGFTIGPKDLRSPFDKFIFLDTLKSYINQSRSLGWITTQQSADKYIAFFDSAKAQLQRGSNRTARTTLDQVLASSVQDSSTVLSSEAFALVYFNTKYLETQIPLPPQYSLTVTTIGSGSVTLDPNASLYDSATTVQLTASPGSGYIFSNWSGSATGSANPLSVVMDGNKSITATFAQNSFTITASAGANGLISPAGAVSVIPGSNLTFTITPNIGYKISDVIVDGSSVGALTSYPFSNVSGNHTISATFTIDHYLTVPAKFSSVQAAVNFARVWDTVAVSPGTYNEAVSVSAKDTLTLLATGAVDQVTVQKFTISSAVRLILRGFIVNGASGNGITISSSPNAVIESNLIRNSSSSGMLVTQDNVRIRIVNNRIHNNASYGINFTVLDNTAPVGTDYVINNTIVQNGSIGIYVPYESPMYLVNNIVSFNGSYGISRGASSALLRPLTPSGSPNPAGIRLINNMIVGNNGTVGTGNSSKDLKNYPGILDATDTGNLTTAGTEGTGVSKSPGATFSTTFVANSPVNLHLKSGAVPVNRGVNSWSPPDATSGAIPTKDFEGTIRPQGTTVDMGADEQ